MSNFSGRIQSAVLAMTEARTIIGDLTDSAIDVEDWIMSGASKVSA